MPKSQIKIGALLSYVVLALNNLVGLLYTPFMLRMMGKSEYGLYSIAASIVAYLTILDLGFGNSIIRYTAKFRAEGKREEQYQMFGMFFLLYCGIGFITLIAGGILYLNAGNIFDSSMTDAELERTKVILLLMVLNLAITFPFSLFGSIVTAYEQFVFQKIVSIVRIVLNTATMIVLLNLGYKAIAMVVVATVFNILTLGLNFCYCRYSIKIKLKFGKIQWGFLKEISIYSLWIFMNAIMDRIYWSTGQFVLGAFVGTASVAVFAVAIQLQHMYMSFSTAISGVFLPKVTAMAVQKGNEEAISDLFIKTGRIQYGIMIFILTGFILFGKYFISLWAGPGYAEAYTIALIIFIPFTVPLIQNIGLVILQARNQMKFRCVLSLAVAVCSLGVQIPMAKYYGGVGCAIGIAAGLVIAQIFVMNIYYQKCQRINVLKFWYEIGKMSIVPLALTFVGYFALNQVSFESFEILGFGIGLYTLFFIPLFFVYSMNDYERKLLVSIFRKKKKFKSSTLCSACAACMNVCSRAAISMIKDENGFYRAFVDESKCNHCGACIKVCPWKVEAKNPYAMLTTPEVWAANLKDDTVRFRSSSGGVFPLLAKKILEQGGYVVGVAQTNGLKYEHVIISSVEQLESLQGPKYVQINPGYIYNEVRNMLKDGKKVLFSGSPCQIAALYAVLGKYANDNLWTVDIVCHGVPSVKIFEKQIDEIESQFANKVEKVLFRDKETGWNRYSMTYLFANGEKYSELYGKSNYMKFFLNRLSQNESCFDCLYRKESRIGDLTLGDFWGVSRYHPELNDDKGTSMVMLNNKHGAQLFYSVDEFFELQRSSLGKAVANNQSILFSMVPNAKRLAFFRDLNELSFEKLTVKYCPKSSFCKKIYILLTGVFKEIRKYFRKISF